MSEQPSLTWSQAIEQVLSELDDPIGFDEFAQRVLAIYPTTAKRPTTALRQHLQEDHIGRTMVYLEDQSVVPMRIAMQGVRFRVSLARQEATQGVLVIHPAFDYFLRPGIDPAAARLSDERGRSLPTKLRTIRVMVDSLFGKERVTHTAFDLGGWFRARRIKRNDSILVTVEDWETGGFRLAHEPAKRRRKTEIAQRDQELADFFFDLLENASDEGITALEAIPTAYARLPDVRVYPGSHWINVLVRDPRLTWDGWLISYGDTRSPLDEMFSEQEPGAQASFSDDQGQAVYRFKAALWHRPKLWRRIEIQGQQTLGELDGILRGAFEHDRFDHLGGFWKCVRRGQTKRFRDVDLGTVTPFGEGSGAEAPLAGLGLEPGQQLKYVYDFGDWIEHKLTLEAIAEPEADAAYPRITDQNKPDYQDCQSCAAQGRTTIATWICLQCSDEQQQEVLVCEECLSRDHEDHYADKILY